MTDFFLRLRREYRCLSTPERVAIWVWILMAVGISIRFLVGSDPARNNVYLKVYAAAADAFVSGDPLYEIESGFRYPPIAAAVFIPFAKLGAVAGSIVWRWVNFAVLLLGIRTVSRAGFPFVLGPRESAFFVIMMAVYNNTSLNNGQVNPVILGLFLFATAGSLRPSVRGPAVAVTGGASFKVYPVAYGMVLAALRPRLLWYLIPAMAVAILLPFVLQSPDYVWREYRSLVDLLGQEDRTHDLSRAYRDLRLVASTSGIPMSALTFTVVRVILGGGIVALCLSLRRAGSAPRRVMDYAFSLTMFWFILCGPATEKSTFGLASASILWPLIAAWRRRERGWCAAWAVVHLLVLADHFPKPLSHAFQFAHPWSRCLQTYAVLIAALMLCVRAASDLRTSHRNRDRVDLLTIRE